MNDIIIKTIVEGYVEASRMSSCPTVASIYQKIQQIIKENALDLLYYDVDFNIITSEMIHEMLKKSFVYHNFESVVYCDAQIPLVPEMKGVLSCEK